MDGLCRIGNKDGTSLTHIIDFCFEYMPSLIEIIEPHELKISSLDVSSFLNDLQAKLHGVDMLVKQLKMENQVLHQTTAALLGNYITVLLRQGNLTSEQLSKLTGVKLEMLEDFLDKLIDAGKIDMKESIYFLKEEAVGVEHGRKRKKVEAVLFAVGKEISSERIASLCSLEIPQVEAIMQALSSRYSQLDNSLQIIKKENGWKLTVRDHYVPLVSNLVSNTELERPLMETLAVIAWRYPIMQSEVVKLRNASI